MRDDILRERKKKRKNLEALGFDVFPARVKRTHGVAEALKSFSALSKSKKIVSLTGRAMSVRKQGGLIFIDLEDQSGDIQVLIKKDSFKQFAVFKENLDSGDFLEVTGVLALSKTKQKSIEAKSLRVIVKSMRPIPTEFYGLKDTETRLRKRYLDLLLNKEEREVFKKKAVFWNEIRQSLLGEDFLEVETPVLESVPGGAEAEPFVTHHNALDEDFYLRISLELPLKRLMVAGEEKVFEIGRIFRNEGISAEHLQDYTQMELYWAYQDYKGLMKFLEKMLKNVIKKTVGSLVTERNGKKINWGKPWKTYDYYKLFKLHSGLDLTKATKEELLKKAKALKIEKASPKLGRGKLIDLIFKSEVRPKLIEPGFLIDPPVDIEPLAKRTDYDSGRVERFQIVAGGTELGKGFSELNDPDDQRARFEEQMKLRASGDKEAQMLDEDYLEAMEYGMPPVGGFGISERFFAVLMNRPVRETTIFPLLRKK